jgi:hypothetical protein
MEIQMNPRKLFAFTLAATVTVLAVVSVTPAAAENFVPTPTRYGMDDRSSTRLVRDQTRGMHSPANPAQANANARGSERTVQFGRNVTPGRNDSPFPVNSGNSLD